MRGGALGIEPRTSSMDLSDQALKKNHTSRPCAQLVEGDRVLVIYQCLLILVVSPRQLPLQHEHAFSSCMASQRLHSIHYISRETQLDNNHYLECPSVVFHEWMCGEG